MVAATMSYGVEAEEGFPADQYQGVQVMFLDGLIGYALRHASNAFMSDFAASMAGTGLRPVLVSILSIIDENPGARQGEIGRALGVARANMAPLMAELEAADFVRRQPDASDRRAVVVTLTDSGKAALRNCKARIKAQERRSLSRLTTAERQTLLRLLKKI